MQGIKTFLNKIEYHLNKYKKGFDTDAHIFEIAELLEKIRDKDHKKFIEIFNSLDNELKADVLSELSKKAQEDIIALSKAEDIAKVIEEMDTDDATDILKQIEKTDETKAEDVLENIDDEDRKAIEDLIIYQDDEAGAYMQTELLSANIDETIGESIKRLKKLKAEGELSNAYHVFIVDDRKRFHGMIPMEELVLYGPNEIYRNIIDKEGSFTISIRPKDNIEKIIELASNYNMNVLPVIDDSGVLLGRITADDIYDLMEKQATEQIYHMAGVDEDDEEQDLKSAAKSRAIWLGINLLTAIFASFVIGMFDSTIQSLVALAVLMPIVASMGGNAGTQSLTVTVRKLSIGDIDIDEAKEVIKKEVILSLFNGGLYAIVMGLIAWIWFNMPLLGVVIGLSMIINLFMAGFFGALIPFILKKAGADPAVGSSVILTTITDVVGFFSFLGLAKVILL